VDGESGERYALIILRLITGNVEVRWLETGAGTRGHSHLVPTFAELSWAELGSSLLIRYVSALTLDC
jgi:hypothetical protein